MTKNEQRKSRLKLTLLVGLGLVAFLFLFMTIYFFAFKETSKSYFIQSWKEYYGGEDWNLTKHIVTDIDGDGQKDMITFTNCAFLSSVTSEKIPSEDQCQAPGMSIMVFPQNENKVGQKLTSRSPFYYQWLRKSYLVKTKNDVWQFYDMNGLQLRKFELKGNALFQEVEPSLFDRIDTVTYQVSQLGVVFLLVVLPH